MLVWRGLERGQSAAEIAREMSDAYASRRPSTRSHLLTVWWLRWQRIVCCTPTDLIRYVSLPSFAYLDGDLSWVTVHYRYAGAGALPLRLQCCYSVWARSFCHGSCTTDRGRALTFPAIPTKLHTQHMCRL